MSNREKINLPPISDILLNHLPGPVDGPARIPGIMAANPVNHARPVQGPPILPPLSRQNSHLPQPVPPPPSQSQPDYNYYNYYYGDQPPQVRYPQPQYFGGASASYAGQYYAHQYPPRPVAYSTSSVTSQPGGSTANSSPAASSHLLNRSPLSHNASPVYPNDSTPPPLMLRHSYKSPVVKGVSPSDDDNDDDEASNDSDSANSSQLARGNSKRKTRNNLPKETTYILLKWLNDHLNHPYPNSFEKNQLMVSTGLNQQQLSNWFINARRRKIKSLKEQRRLNLV